MKKRVLKIPTGYNPKTQAKIGYVAAQLDDQLKLLKKDVEGLTVKQLEWQQKPGMNTIGILLAHIALVEIWWLAVVPKGLSWEPDGKKLVKKTCGFEDDGIPLKADAGHYPELKGFTIEQYLKALANARRVAHRELKELRDTDLDKCYTTYRGDKITFGWTLYHVLEHFCGHYGQILLLKHLMCDVGVLKK
jgi:hypothetical protein